MIVHADHNSLYPHMARSLGGEYYSPWKRKFIFLWKYQDEWIFCRWIHVRHRLIWTLGEGEGELEDYAVNDFELLQKSTIE